MKKILCLLLSMLLLVSLAACGDDSSEETEETMPVILEPEVPEEPETQTELEFPDDMVETVPDDVLEIIAFEGMYKLEGEDEAQEHILEITCHDGFLTMEHGLYQEGSLYSFWVEEYWPDANLTHADIAAAQGLVRSFSLQTSVSAYEEAAAVVTLCYEGDGITIDRGETREYYVYDHTLPGIHQGAATLFQQLGSVTVDETIAGNWYAWDGNCYTDVHFGENGTFTWMNKMPGSPVEVYQGAWGISQDNEIVIAAERLGSGTMPYFANLGWEYDETTGLTLTEQTPFLLQGYEGSVCLRTEYVQLEDMMTQSTALS